MHRRFFAAVALFFGGASACTTLLGVDFDGHIGQRGADASGSGRDGYGVEDDATVGDDDDGGVMSPDGEMPPGVDLAWTRWAVSGAFPSDQTTAADGMVSDRVTGLVWAQAPLPESLEWDKTAAGCVGLRLGGFADWRVPTRIEFLSLANYFFSPAVSADLTMPTAETWTSSPFAHDPTRAWMVELLRGSAVGRTVTDSLMVRCVRAGRVMANAPPNRFVAGFGTLFDTQTNLTWQGAPTVSGTLAAAKIHCANLMLNGVGGFRIPEVHELHSIVDERRIDPALDPAFASRGLTWSRTPRVGAVDLGWTIDEYDGHTISYGTDQTAGARCVK